jgi:hypothetical protein
VTVDINREEHVNIRIWCTFGSGIAFSIFFHHGSDALRDRVEWCELVCDPATLYESREHHLDM